MDGLAPSSRALSKAHLVLERHGDVDGGVGAQQEVEDLLARPEREGLEDRGGRERDVLGRVGERRGRLAELIARQERVPAREEEGGSQKVLHKGGGGGGARREGPERALQLRRDRTCVAATSGSPERGVMRLSRTSMRMAASARASYV